MEAQRQKAETKNRDRKKTLQKKKIKTFFQNVSLVKTNEIMEAQREKRGGNLRWEEFTEENAE